LSVLNGFFLDSPFSYTPSLFIPGLMEIPGFRLVIDSIEYQKILERGGEGMPKQWAPLQGI